MRNITINAAIEELLREHDIRAMDYPQLVARGKMKQSVSDLHRLRLVRAIELLRWMQDNERLIKQRLAQ